VITRSAPVSAPRKFVVTLLLATVLAGAYPPPARAQVLGGIVHDPVTLAAHIREWAEEFRHWIETVQFYANTVENLVDSATSLRGILQTAEKALGYNKEMLQTISNIGRTIRTAFQVKTMMEGLVRGRLAAVQRIHDRLANGIFDPARDRQDLKDYLRYEIGDISERTLGDIERIELYDTKLQLMDAEHEVVKKRIAESEQSAKEVADRLDQMRAHPDQVTQLDIQLAQLEAQQRQYTTDLARDRERVIEMEKELLTRREQIAKDAVAARDFGRQIDTYNDAWSKLTKATNDLAKWPPGDAAAGGDQ
jgi:hypothetical protein